MSHKLAGQRAMTFFLFRAQGTIMCGLQTALLLGTFMASVDLS